MSPVPIATASRSGANTPSSQTRSKCQGPKPRSKSCAGSHLSGSLRALPPTSDFFTERRFAGAHRCHRARRRYRRHLGRAASRQARPVGGAGRSRRPGRGDLLRQCRHHRGQHACFRRLSRRDWPTLVRIALKRSPLANYHLAFLPRIAPWLAGLPRRVAAGAPGRDRAERCGRCSRARSPSMRR